MLNYKRAILSQNYIVVDSGWTSKNPVKITRDWDTPRLKWFAIFRQTQVINRCFVSCAFVSLLDIQLQYIDYTVIPLFYLGQSVNRALFLLCEYPHDPPRCEAHQLGSSSRGAKFPGRTCELRPCGLGGAKWGWWLLKHWLVGGLEHGLHGHWNSGFTHWKWWYVSGWWWLEHGWIMTFHSVGNFIIPTDEHSIIFQRGRSTTNQIGLSMI